MPREFVNYYFRERQPDDNPLVHATYYPQAFRAGEPLPKAKDGMVHDTVFRACDFHDSCQAVKFVNCTFIDCWNAEKLIPETGPVELFVRRI
jgi:hypothetical protein